MNGELFPPDVFTIWTITILLTALVFVPLAVYSLFRLLRAAWSIQRYAKDAVAPAQAIAASTAALPALDDTISVAGEILAAAGNVAAKLDTVASALEARAPRLG